MAEKILFVDDEPNILSGIRRQLHGKYDLLTAESGKEGIELLKKNKKCVVVISDYKMPLMNGVQFLTQVRKESPDTVRMMLTGQADMQAIVDVINQGNIFRFLSKPCPPELLEKNIQDGIEQYRLINAEKELLSKTLGGCLQVMTDILVLAKPQAFNRGIRVKAIVKKMLEKMKVENSWQIEIAAMLSQIGCVTVPDSILEKVYKNLPIQPDDRMIYQLHTITSSEIITKIPRLEGVAKIILYQEKYYNGTGFPRDIISGKNLPLGSRMLRLALDYDNLIQMGNPIDETIQVIKTREGWYDDRLIEVLEMAVQDKGQKRKFIMKDVTVDELTEDMYLSEDVISASGAVIGGKNQKVSGTLIVTLHNYIKNKEINDKVSVLFFVD